MRTINIGPWHCGHTALSMYLDACGVCVVMGTCPSLLPKRNRRTSGAGGGVSLTAPASYHEVRAATNLDAQQRFP
jgi:hypothetical protein